MKNIIIYAPVRTGRTMLAKRLRAELGDRIGTVLVVDELFAAENFNLDKDFLIVCMGWTEISPEEEFKQRPNGNTLEYIKQRHEECKHVRAAAQKLNLKYFDVSHNREQGIDTVLAYIAKSI